MLGKLPTSCTVISSGDSKHYLRIVGQEEEVTLPLTQAGPLHRSYILATWVKSYQPTLRKWLPNLEAGPLEAKLAETLWERTLICGAENDDFTIHAWICGEPGVLHYVYIPPELRGKGMARTLIQHVCGYEYQYGRPWPFKRGPKGGTYNPYLLRDV